MLQYKIRWAKSSAESMGGLAKETPAPDFNLKDLEGKPVALTDFRGQVVILDFWATWCRPCRSEFTELKGWIERRKKEDQWQNIVVVAVNLKEDPTVVERYLQQRELPFRVVLDRDGAVAEQYKVRALPSLYVIDPRGTIQDFHAGYQPGLSYSLDLLIKRIQQAESP